MSGPTPTPERALAPDLARGIALLGIGWANVVWFVRPQARGPGLRPVDGSVADRWVDAAATLLVDNRSYPLFAALLGYGTVQVLRREQARGTPWPAAQGIIIRRGVALAALGFLHALIAFEGDILTTYGVLSLSLLLVAGWRDRSVLLAAGVLTLALGGLASQDGLVSDLARGDTALGAVGLRLGVWTLNLLAVFVLCGLVAPMLLGAAAARHRVLDDPAAHVTLLRRISVGGLLVGLVGGVPLALVVTRVWDPPAAAAAMAGFVHGVSGLAQGLAYGAIAALATVRWSGRHAPAWARAVAAAGAVSLSAYLSQSVAYAVVFEPWTGDLGRRTGSAGAFVVALAVWVLVVLAAVTWRHAGGGHRPPAEALLRWIAYGRQPMERQGRARSAAT